MNIAEIERRLRDIAERPFAPEEFIYDFLKAFDNIPAATVTKLRQGNTNKARRTGGVLLRGKFYYRTADTGKSSETVDAMVADPLTQQNAPQFLLATDGVDFFCRDLKADKTLDTPFERLNDAFDFFLPLAGAERYEVPAENQADVKATLRLAALYDAILEANPGWREAARTHELNLLMTRLLFCFFAQATAILENHLFSSILFPLTEDSGSNVPDILGVIFRAMDTPLADRAGLPQYACRFGYVNGGLFSERAAIPVFSRRARRLLKECAALSWGEINPDIFGSMIQSIVNPDMRVDMGMHYTNVPNIMRALRPLFLQSLEEDTEAAWDSEAKLQKVLRRIYSIRIFDPACGSGNFLIIAYRELRNLENRIFARLKEIAKQWSLPMTGIRLNHFYGIELADFAVETAKLSLWISEYQMNAKFKAIFGVAPPMLPLRDSGNIVHDNALRRNWNDICPKGESYEVFVVGNPPWRGARYQKPDQKADLAHVFDGHDHYKDCDYVSGWLLRAADYVRGANASFALVSTNSVCQGEQVAYIWSRILRDGLEISFACDFFKWKNNARDVAGVTCTVIGVRNKSNRPKYIHSSDIRRMVSNITPYLTTGQTTLVWPAREVLNGLPRMIFGNQARDDGNLFLTPPQRESLLRDYPEAAPLIRKVVGTDEVIYDKDRYCLWIEDDQLALADSIPPICERIRAVERFRLGSPAATTNAYARIPHKFAQRCHRDEECIVVPGTSSEKRYCIPIVFLPPGVVATNLVQIVYDADLVLFGILMSRMHMAWIRTIGGGLETRLRYSSEICYNTFPLPELTTRRRDRIETLAMNVIATREAHPGKTLEWLYGETMPPDLAGAHRELDAAVDALYQDRPFKNDVERLELLLRMYASMAAQTGELQHA